MNDDYLFGREGSAITVTRHWFRMGNQSHAIHYLRRLSLDKSAPPRGAATLVFFITLLSTLVLFVHIQRDNLPSAIAWVLLVSCVGLMIVSFYIAFVKADKNMLTIHFNDGESIFISLPAAGDINELHDALREAIGDQPKSNLSSSAGAAYGGTPVDRAEDAEQNSRQNAHRAYVIGTHKSGRKNS